MLQPIIHYSFHFLAPGLIAFFFFRNQWKKAWLIMLTTMLIDLDHLLANPVFDPDRCSINFHHELNSDTIQVVFFDWHYKNSYDDRQGTAKAKIVLYDDIFSLRIVTEDLEILIYDGYAEGEIDFSEFY